MLDNKKSILDKFSFGRTLNGKKPEIEKPLSRDFLIGSGPLIDADFVDLDNDSGNEACFAFENDNESIENLIEYLRSRPSEELSEIFVYLSRILEGENDECEFMGETGEDESTGKKESIKEISKNVFGVLSSKACREKERIQNISKNASINASRVAFERKESAKKASSKIYNRVKNSSPAEREFILILLEIAILRKPSTGRSAALSILSLFLNNDRFFSSDSPYDEKIKYARDLNSKGNTREAGLVAGVLLEKALYELCRKHGIELDERYTPIKPMNNLLKNSNIYDAVTWKEVSRLSDIRNKCCHHGDRPPSREEVENLILGVSKFVKHEY